MNNPDRIKEAKAKLDLLATARLIGCPITDKPTQCCPFHDDKTPSFSVYRNEKTGELHWKCHAGCGEGDQIDLIATHKNISNAEACKEFLRLADINLSSRPQSNRPPLPPFDWQACVNDMTPERVKELAEWRDYAPEFVEWLRREKLAGIYAGKHFAFPVTDADTGKVIGCHYRLSEDGSWRYAPKGLKTTPLVIGDLAQAKAVYVFESQWDLLALPDAYAHHENPLPEDIALVATRGASNDGNLSKRIGAEAKIYAFPQNDDPGQEWLEKLAKHNKCEIRRVNTPEGHKDLNEWTRTAQTREAMQEAIAKAIGQAEPIAPHWVDKEIEAAYRDDEAKDPSLAPFPTDALPHTLREFVKFMAKALRVPESLVALCALGTVSASLGKGLVLNSTVSGLERFTPGNLYILVIAESGSGKSEVFKHCIRPIEEWEVELVEKHKEIEADAEANIGHLKARIDALKKVSGKNAVKGESREALRKRIDETKEMESELAKWEKDLTPPRRMVSDITTEALAQYLEQNNETGFSATAEARGMESLLTGRYSKDKNLDIDIYLKGYSGDPVRVDRVMRGRTSLEEPCLAILWLMQPDAGNRLLGNRRMHVAGLWPRTLFCDSHAEPQKINLAEAQNLNSPWITRYNELVRVLLESYRESPPDARKVVKLSPEARSIYVNYHDEVIERLKGELSDLGPHAARFAENLLRVALVSHAAKCVPGSTLDGGPAPAPHETELSDETMNEALRIMLWFENQLFSLMQRHRREQAAEQEAEVIKLLDSKKWVTPRMLCRARIARTAALAKELLDRMTKAGTLESETQKPPEGGHALTFYRLASNPVPE